MSKPHFEDLLQMLTLNYYRFTEKENVSGIIQAKGTVIKAIRTKLIEDYPHIENYIDEILPKKDNVRIVKWYCK